jgi:two-component system, cell cycle response regulator
MAANATTFLLASPEPALLNMIEPALSASGPRVEVVLSAAAALAAMTTHIVPALALLDVNLPDMETGELLARARTACGNRFPIVLILDSASQEWIDRLAEGLIDDVILRHADPAYWQLRIGLAIHTHRLRRELDSLRKDTAKNAQLDRLTGVYNRETLLSLLFRETDRVQRLNGALSLLLFDVDDFGHWNSRLGPDACDELLCQVAGRASRLLRSYDLIGRAGKDEFLLALPGCDKANAVMLAERLRAEVFCQSYRVAGESIRLSACFGIASSNGRSPVVVLREAEQALTWAKDVGPESIQCFGDQPLPEVSPVTFLSANSGDELMAW